MLRSWGGRTARARAGFCPAWTLQSCSVAYAKPADSSPRPRSPGRERAAMSVGAQRLREDADAIRRGAVDKGEDPTIVDRALEVDAHRRTLLGEGDRLKNERNTASKRIGDAIRGGASPTGSEVAALRQASVDAGARIEAIDRDLAAVEAELEQLLLRIPNPADPDVPVGGPEANTVIRTWGEPLPAEARDPERTWTRRPHWEVADRLRMIDLERGAKISGSGFPLYRGWGSTLQRTLIDWFLDVHTREHGLTEIWLPALVNAASA